MTDVSLLFAGGLLAGVLGGLLGIGGGVVLMPLLRFVVGLSPAYAAGTCIVAVFFTTLGGSYRHYRLGHVRARPLVPVILAGAATTVVFSLLFEPLARHEHWLDLGFGIVFTAISIRMITEGLRHFSRGTGDGSARGEFGGSLLGKFSIGGLAGILPGLLGIGTGVVLVPAFNLLLHASIKVAVASSLVCFSFNALISSAFKIAQGFTRLEVALPICVSAVIGANIGAILNKRFASNVVKLLFGLLFFYVSLKFILSAFEVNI
jgi:uncharacterized membrane protein YfcA